MKCIVESRKFRLWIEGAEILKGVDFCAPRNSISVIVGPSGSGKSTFLKSINRIIEIHGSIRRDGDILLDGVSVYSLDPVEVRRRVAMVFQIPNPFPHLSIFENVALPARVNGVAKNKSELNELVRWALEKAMLWDEVRDRLDKKPGVLSGGQKQRLCLARALAMKPEVLLLDEPTANIDVINAKKIEESLRELKNEVTIILVTHNPNQALRIGDFVNVMYDGRIIESGPVREIVFRARNEIALKLLSEGW
ncbi:phosphate ABC transporter ATP-binding protein [Thermogladius sp. 4427co]|uniref:phosphate ABC transporter ATP-binding protein n=1 Tax=Thermogladius sp. 4427co TaxID=3450718 RepID=UPI003F7ABEB9